MSSNFISCTKWIKRGVAKSSPDVLQFTKKELKYLVDKAKSDILAAADDIKTDGDSKNKETSNDDQFGMNDYDKENDADTLLGISNLIELDDESETEDPVSKMEDENEDENDSDKEDDEIKPTDNLIVVGHVNGDISLLEVYVFNEEDNDLYVHHDIVLPTIPLALEWLSYVPDSTIPGNLLAIGGMAPEITIWNLDVVNSLEPLLKLGEYSNKKKHRHRNHGHRDAVLDLSWNPKLPHALASASVDRSVLLWDLNQAKALGQFNDFKEKVQAIQWHPTEVNLLIAGDCNSTVSLLDGRIVESLLTFNVSGEVEKLAWHPTAQQSVIVGTSTGVLCCVDCRTGKQRWKINAHTKEITGLGIHADRPDRIITCSTDQTVNVWSIADDRDLLLTHTKQFNLGELQSLQLCPENPDIFCVGGNKRSNNFKVINVTTEMGPYINAEEMETGIDESV